MTNMLARFISCLLLVYSPDLSSFAINLNFCLQMQEHALNETNRNLKQKVSKHFNCSIYDSKFISILWSLAYLRFIVLIFIPLHKVQDVAKMFPIYFLLYLWQKNV